MFLSTYINKLHTVKTAGEMLFQGYEDPILDVARSMPFSTSDLPPMDKFCWFFAVSLNITQKYTAMHRINK